MLILERPGYLGVLDFNGCQYLHTVACSLSLGMRTSRVLPDVDRNVVNVRHLACAVVRPDTSYNPRVSQTIRCGISGVLTCAARGITLGPPLRGPEMALCQEFRDWQSPREKSAYGKKPADHR